MELALSGLSEVSCPSFNKFPKGSWTSRLAGILILIIHCSILYVFNQGEADW